MKRAQSALTLRHLAHSLQSSIQSHSRQATGLHSRHPHASTIDLSQEQQTNRIFILQKQIAALEHELSSSKSTIRNYSKQLTQYENISSNIVAVENKIEGQWEKERQLRNQWGMLMAQCQSIQFNSHERIAEKQYFEELIDTHHLQYPQESQIVTRIIAVEKQTRIIQLQQAKIIQQMEKGQKDLEDWKKENSYDLSQHKIKNTIKLQRIELIGWEDKCDFFCQTHNLRSLRELHCLFFKQYAKRNGINHQEAEQGIDIFLCKQGLVEEFSEFVRERLVYDKPHCQDIQNYLNQFSRMEQLFRNNNCEYNKKLYEVQVEELSLLKKGFGEKEDEVGRNKEIVRGLENELEQQFGKDSLAIIDYLREKNNKYDIREIKITLKQTKNEQERRIKGIKQAHSVVAHLETVIAKQETEITTMQNQQQLLQIEEDLHVLEAQLQELNAELARLKDQKTELESLINGAITKWRERDENKIKLKQLYQELNTAKNKSQQKPEVTRKQFTLERSVSFRDIPVKKSIFPSDCPSIQSSTFKQGKNSFIYGHKNKSVLSLKNPNRNTTSKEVEQYEPILSNCQMILSKKLSNQPSKELSTGGEDCPKVLMSSRTDSVGNFNKTKPRGMSKNKENDIWAVRTKMETTSKCSGSLKPSISLSIQNSKAKMANSQRTSLSKLLITKFNR